MNRSKLKPVVFIVVGLLAVAIMAIIAVLLWPKPTSPTETANAPGLTVDPSYEPAKPEREAATAVLAASVKKGQEVKRTSNETTINLKPYVNCALDQPVASPATMTENSLVELPAGVNLYDGVPFDVSGVIQIYGDDLAQAGLALPKKVEGIAIGRKFSRLHILHGSAGAESKNFGVVIARLVIHYADGSQANLDIISGQHLLGWVGPYWQKYMPRVEQAGSHVAWIGSNPFIKRSNLVNDSVHLWSTTFANPKADVSVTSIDCVSGESVATPFLVGMTVE